MGEGMPGLWLLMWGVNKLSCDLEVVVYCGRNASLSSVSRGRCGETEPSMSNGFQVIHGTASCAQCQAPESLPLRAAGHEWRCDQLPTSDVSEMRAMLAKKETDEKLALTSGSSDQAS